MSTKGIYTALSGAIAQQNKLDTVANNLANANTPSFKRDRQVFKEYLTAYEKSPDVIQVPKVPASIDSFYHMQGGDKAYVDGAGTFTDFSQGSIKPTGSPFDVAINGKGSFFEIATPQGVRYTRNGSFTINNDGMLVTKQGFPVLNNTPGGVEQRQIRLNPNTQLQIGLDGTISQGAGPIGRLAISTFNNPQALRKIGNSMYIVKETMDPQVQDQPQGQVMQGSLEMSNVNVVQEMTEMIKTTRTFESLQKAIQAYDQMNGKLVNDVPKF